MAMNTFVGIRKWITLASNRACSTSQAAKSVPFYTKLFRRSNKEQPADQKDGVEQKVMEEERIYRQQKLEEREKWIQRQQNKSRLAASDRRILQGKAPYIGITLLENDKHREPSQRAQMLARYGLATDIDPSVAWPTSDQISDLRAYESVLNDGLNLAQMMRRNKELKKAKHEEMMAKEEEYSRNLASMKKELANLKRRIEANNKLAEIERTNRQLIMAELREEFGYDVNPSDPQFADKIATKEKEFAKRAKEEKKKLKLERKDQFSESSDDRPLH